MAKDKSAPGVPGERQMFYFQYVTTPTSDTPGTSIMLHFNNRRYFLGRIAEGTQRACIQRGIGIKKVRNVFLTGPTEWNSMGGLTGMILTMADVQHDEIDPETGRRPRLRIQGGPKISHSIACARRFIFRTGMPLEVIEAKADDSVNQPSYSDENITVWSIPIRRRGRSGASSPNLTNGRSQSPNTIGREQMLRAETVKNMFDSDWRKDRLVESQFDEVKLPALIWTRDLETKELTSVQCMTMADAPHLQPDSKVFVRNPWPASLVNELPPVDNISGSVSMSYIVRGKPQRGKFLPKKAKDLGVKPGPDFARLTAGGSITLDDGTVVTSDMVLEKTEPGKGMAILDVPTPDYLADLQEKIEGLDEGTVEGVEFISWLLGPGVFYDPNFIKLIESMPKFQHFISAPEVGSDHLALDSAAASSIRLAQIRPECFKVPQHNNELPLAQPLSANIPYITAERGLMIHVTPKYFVSRTEVPPLLDVESTQNSYQAVLKDLMPVLETVTASEGPFDDVQILTLGTGSAVPSKYRNVSATLVRIPSLGSYLFDCGENTLGTLRRAYTSTELDEILADLRMIWISHLHADHHLGTMSIINAKREVMQRLGKTEPKLYVIGEPNMSDYLNDYSSIESSSHCELLGVNNSKFVIKNRLNSGESTHISQTSLPISKFWTTRVSHCHGAQACSITFQNGFKFSYSGDCRPSRQFAKIGQGSDVLLHEATFDDGLEGDAMAKKHSTTGEALAVAHAMKAKNVVLTHFSQRYQKIPVLNDVKFSSVSFEEGDESEAAGPIEDTEMSHSTSQMPAEATDEALDKTPAKSNGSTDVSVYQKLASEMNVCVAFDLMSVTVGQIRDMYKYYPAIEKMFEMEHEKSEAIRTERREAGERLKEKKEMRVSGSSKPKTQPKATKSQSDTSQGASNIYERINRNKSKPKGDQEMNGTTTATVTNAFNDSANPTGDIPVISHESAQPQMSKKAQNRETKKQLRKERNTKANHTRQEQAKFQILVPDSRTEDAAQSKRALRQLSPDGSGTNEAQSKRIKTAPEAIPAEDMHDVEIAARQG